jgi:integrase
MGRGVQVKLRYVHQYKDRHGKPRRYFRRPGFNKVALAGKPGSPEFMSAYQAALDGATPRVAIGASRTKPGTINATVIAYYRSVAFINLAPETQRTRRNILEAFRRDNGDKRLAMLERRHIADMVSEKAALTPAAAQGFLKAIRALTHFCQSIGMIDHDPAAGVKGVKLRSAGIYTWTEGDIAGFATKHPIGSRARLALALLLYTAQRRSDVIRMGRQHIRDGAIHVTQRKTGAVLAVPLHPELAAIIEATPSDHLTFLVTRDGSPFSPAGFGNLFRKWCNEAGLPKKCSAHGLRKAACRRLAEAGCSAPEIMSISGIAACERCSGTARRRIRRAWRGRRWRRSRRLSPRL